MADRYSPTDQRSMRERMLAGDLYIADDPQLAHDNLRAMRLLERFNQSAAAEPAERRRLLGELQVERDLRQRLRRFDRRRGVRRRQQHRRRRLLARLQDRAPLRRRPPRPG
jgi:hypothetical protein